MGRRKLTDAQRVAVFWSRVAVGEPGECWLWKGGLFDNGYGAFRYDDKTRLAHRFAAALKQSVEAKDLPEGVVVCHHCDIKACVNPEHLFLGTYADNMQDASQKGRMSHGERAKQAKLTEQDVREIRASPMTHAWLARHYGVDDSNIYCIRKRKTWKHVD
jgi:hypothetical protein